ncbi:MAG: hypothetical protein IPM94_11935 [bacterium]|nr:hypothetical protein [bacterium]
MNLPDHPRLWLLRPVVVVAVLVLAGAVFLASTVREIRSARGTLEQLTIGHAEQIQRVVGESQAHALAAFEAWETQAGERLLALASLVDHLVQDGRRSHAVIDSIAAANDLTCLTVHWPDRRAESAAADGEAACWHELDAAGASALRPGESRVLRVPAPDGGGYRLIGALRRADGGVVCAGMDAAVLAAERRRIGPGRLLQALGQSSGTTFLALQDGGGILAATPNVDQLSSLAGDTLLAGVMATGIPATRETAFAGRRVLERVSRLDVDGRPVSLLRVGLDLGEVERRQREIGRSLAVHSLLLLAALGAGASLLIASRRLAAARSAWAAARREVTALEEERARRERSFALGELASGVAHEIRNPLNAIHVVAQRLAGEFVPTQDEAEYRQLTGTVRGEVGRINRIVEQFLRFARPPSPRPRPTDAAALVRDVVTLVRGRFEAKGVSLAAAAPERLELVADPDLLRQALHNLLDNALGACPAGAGTDVELRAAGDRVLLVVRDGGCGIAPENLGRIFNLYHTTKPDGTGLGLAVVDQIAAQHGGRVLVDSRPGHGSTFTLELPRSGPTEDAG